MGKVDEILKELEESVKKIEVEKPEEKAKRVEELMSEEIEMMKAKITEMESKFGTITEVLETLKGGFERSELEYSRLGELKDKMFDIERMVDDLKRNMTKFRDEIEVRMNKTEEQVERPLKAARRVELEVEDMIPRRFMELEKRFTSIKEQIEDLGRAELRPEEFVTLDKRLDFLEGEVDILLDRIGRAGVIQKLRNDIKTIYKRQEDISAAISSFKRGKKFLEKGPPELKGKPAGRKGKSVRTKS